MKRYSFDGQEMLTLEDMELFIAAHENQISTLIIKTDKGAKHRDIIDVVE